MRPVFFILFYCLFLSTAAQAQWSVGASAGANTSYFQIEKIPNSIGEYTSGGRFGWQAEAMARYTFGPRLQLSTGLGYRQMNVNWGDCPIGCPEQVYQAAYLRLPLALDITPTEQWFISVGAEAAWISRLPSKREEWQRYDYGLVAGAGIRITERLQFRLSHYFGLPRVAEGRFSEEQNLLRGVYYFRNRSVQAKITYYLPLQAPISKK